MSVPDTRGASTAPSTPQPGEIRGIANEVLSADQSVAEWRQRAMSNGVEGLGKGEGTDRDMNAYWAERCGIRRPSIETRALGEDTSSGAGAGQAIVPQQWSTTFVDLLRSKLVLSKAGVSTLPMTTEQYHLPQWMADIPQPAWIVENAATSLDANPQLAPVLFNAAGAYIDVTLVSRQILEDTNQAGGLDGLLRDVISQKYARLIESVAFYGTAGKRGNPGLVTKSVW